jgi:hypothetical protein
MLKRRPLLPMAAFACAATLTPAAADPVQWETLARQPGALSAVASAVAMTGRCVAPLTFDQSQTETTLKVAVVCSNTGDGAGATIVTFQKFGKRLFVKGFEFEG